MKKRQKERKKTSTLKKSISCTIKTTSTGGLNKSPLNSGKNQRHKNLHGKRKCIRAIYFKYSTWLHLRNWVKSWRKKLYPLKERRPVEKSHHVWVKPTPLVIENTFIFMHSTRVLRFNSDNVPSPTPKQETAVTLQLLWLRKRVQWTVSLNRLWPYLPKWVTWILSEIFAAVNDIKCSLKWCKNDQNRSIGFEIMTM